jgi:hypothetical protein
MSADPSPVVFVGIDTVFEFDRLPGGHVIHDPSDAVTVVGMNTGEKVRRVVLKRLDGLAPDVLVGGVDKEEFAPVMGEQIENLISAFGQFAQVALGLLAPGL